MSEQTNNSATVIKPIDDFERPIRKDELDIANKEILYSILTNGLLSHAEQAKIGKETHSSATSGEKTQTIAGNIINQETVAEYKPANGNSESSFSIKSLDTGCLLIERTGQGYILSADDFYESWNRFQKGSTNPSDIKLGLTGKSWDSILYDGDTAVLPVIAERPYIEPPAFPSSHGNTIYEGLIEMNCEDMMEHSVLAVVPFDKIKNHSLYNMPSLIEGPNEYNAIDRIPFEDITLLLVPQALEPLSNDTFPREVIERKIRYVPTVKKPISVYGKWIERPMKVPDYESQLVKLMQDNPRVKYWVHGVRLLVWRDIHFRNEQKNQNVLLR